MPPALRGLEKIILISAVLAAAGWWVFWAYFDTYHLATVQPGILYRDGVRSLHQFQLAAERTHVKTIVSLVDDQEIQTPPFTDELAYCKEHGIDVIRVPIDLGGWPAGDQVRKFLSIVADPSRRPVLVHCAQGVRRTGMMVAAYQLSVLNLTRDQTLAAMLTFGHSQRTVGDIERFIENYDPQTQSMTQELPRSVE
ncbi:MAG: tyrosine-protein phosphatase [Tepidisphaeraceae bacterium]|jgi:protein tyrosine/serine phosphatase